MLQSSYRRKGIKLSHVWFASSEDLNNQSFRCSKADIYYLHGVADNHSFSTEHAILVSAQKSFIKDLSMSEEEIFLSFGKHLRKHIRKCERDNEATIKIFTSNELLNDKKILLICKFLFEKMFTDKSMNVKFNSKLAHSYCLSNALTAFVAYIDDIPVGFSLTVKDANNARAWVSAFNYRNNNMDQHILSRAHRLLNWKRLIYHKAEGIHWFDFGGITDFVNPDEKGQFKAEFGMELPIEYNNYLIAGSFIGKLLLRIKYRK